MLYGLDMTPSRRLGCAVALVAAGTLLPVVPAAQATPSDRADLTEDATYTPASDPRTVIAAPDEKLTDIVSTFISYKKRYVVAEIEARDVGRQVFPWVRVRGEGADITYVGLRGNGTRVRGFRLTDGGTKYFPCERARRTVDTKTNVYRLRIPASCFGTPFRLDVGAALGRETVQDGERRFYVDDASDDPGRFAHPRLSSVVRQDRH